MSNVTPEIKEDTVERPPNDSDAAIRQIGLAGAPSASIGESVSADGREKGDKRTQTESPTSDSHSRASTRKKAAYMWLALVAVAALVAIAVAVYLLNRRATSSTRTETPSVTETTSAITLSPEQRAAIAVEVVQKRSVQTDVTVPGKIAFNGSRVTAVLSQFSGRIVKLDATVESTVRAGQVLGTIDTPDIVGI